MRKLMVAAAMLGTVSAAHAADMPDLPVLRGGFTDGLSKTTRNWDGAYVGGSAGYTTDATDFSQTFAFMTSGDTSTSRAMNAIEHAVLSLRHYRG